MYAQVGVTVLSYSYLADGRINDASPLEAGKFGIVWTKQWGLMLARGKFILLPEYGALVLMSAISDWHLFKDRWHKRKTCS